MSCDMHLRRNPFIMNIIGVITLAMKVNGLASNFMLTRLPSPSGANTKLDV